MACSSFFPKSTSAFLLTAFCLLSLIILLFHSSDYCNEEGVIANGYSCVFVNKKTSTVGLMQLQHRKLLASSKKKDEILEVKNDDAATSGKGKEDMDGWELRTAPLGPDPLHHHGGSPKPRISP